jgi:aldehyde dehydrogenase
MAEDTTSVPKKSLYKDSYGHFIDGQWVGGRTGKTIELRNPATGEFLSKIQAGGAEDINLAVAAAKKAFPKWAATSAQERQAIFLEIARRLRARLNDYAMLESLNNGKTISEATFFDLPTAIGQFELLAGAAYQLDGRTVDYPDAIGMVHREPLGVCALIIPWNVPLIMMAAKVAPAIIAGNTVVLKPAETVCLSVMEFFSEMADIIPPGVVNVITGYGQDVGEALVSHRDVRKVSFTGSTVTARKIMQYASQNVIPQTLELGGKSAQIVCRSANIDAAVEGAAMSTVMNKGEICFAGSRIFVHKAVKEEFTEKLTKVIKGIRIGDPLNPATQLGAQASLAQFDKISGYLDIAPREGATVLTGGQRASGAGLDNGYFISPTILDNVTHEMRVAREEIFGPVTCLFTWDDPEDVVRLANDSRYGLAGGIWTKELTEAHRFARALETGTIWINRYYNLLAGMPVGGYKESGFGRELSLDSVMHYTTTKSVMMNLTDTPIGVFGH